MLYNSVRMREHISETTLSQLCKVDCLQGPLLAAVLLLACAAVVYRRLSNQVYLLDFACYRPADEYQVTWKRFMAGSRDCGVSHLCIHMCKSLHVLGTARADAWHVHTQGKEVDCMCSNSRSCCALWQCRTALSMLVASIKASKLQA